MDRLIINPDSEQAWEVPLRPGRNTVGRAEDCDVVLTHDSVAAQHAEIEVSGRRVMLRDLSSERGSWREGQRVVEIELEPGTEVTLGEVTVRFDGEARAVELEDAPAAPVVARLCKHHPRAAARWHCPRCQRDFCDACVNVHGGGRTTNHFCRTCAIECEAVEVPAGFVPGTPEAETDFWVLLGRAFGYPFAGNGPVLLLAGFFLLLFVEMMMYLSRYALLFGVIALVILVVGAGGYVFSYCKRIIESTANGDDSPPDWPEITDFSADILSPFLQGLALAVVVFGPAIVAGMVTWDHPLIALLLPLVLLGLGGALAPIGMLALAIFDRVLALNPAVLVPSMLRCPGHYLVTTVLFTGAFAVRFGLDLLIEWLVPVMILPTVISTAVGLYLLVVAMRVLGVFYRANTETLGWMRREAG